MEDEIRTKVGDTGRTRIVCRSGNPVDLADIEVVNPDSSRSIIILGPETENPDSAVIKTILAITNHPKRRPEPYHIVAEIRDPQNMEVARMVGRHEAQLVLVGDLDRTHHRANLPAVWPVSDLHRTVGLRRR